MNADSSGALGVYLSKLALEVTGVTLKTGRRTGSRTMWQVLQDGLATGLADDLETWFAYEMASHGRKQVTFSRGLRRRFRLADEQSDDEIAGTDLGSDDLIALSAETWHQIRGQAEQLLTAAELGGLAGAAAWLDQRGLTWSLVGRPRGPRSTASGAERECPLPTLLPG